MKTGTKILGLALAAILLVGASVLGTMAYLTSTDSVENTFTVGNVKITLDEAKVDEYGEKDGTTRVRENTYKLLPGHTYKKDPTIHVDADSEDCYLFVKVENEIAAIEDGTTIAQQIETNSWTSLSEGSEIYYQEYKANSEAQNINVFGEFKIKGDVANDTLASFTGKTIVVTAYAVQADGFTNAMAAWNATFGAPSVGEGE